MEGFDFIVNGKLLRGMTDFRAWLAAAVVVAGFVFAPAAHAGFCSATACTQILNIGNGGTTGNFGTVNMTLSGNTVTIDVTLAAGFKIIKTGFPGAFGFGNNLGGGLTFSNFSSSAYSGSESVSVNDIHFDGFGRTSDAAATTGPHAGSSSALQQVSFEVSKAGLNDVRDLLQLFKPGGGGPAYFVVDAFDGNGSCGHIFSSGCTGLLAISSVPEPASGLLLVSGLLALGVLRRKKTGRLAP